MSRSARRWIRIAGGTIGAGALLVAGAGSAFAHECYVANRSDQGNTMAGTNSAAWQMVSLNELLTDFIQLPPNVASCVEAAVPADFPSSFVLGAKQAVGQEGVIAGSNPNMASELASDGQGIDHGESSLGPVLEPFIVQCFAQLPRTS